MNIDIKIRYNTLCNDDKLYWRILIDGKEHICSEIDIKIPVHTTMDNVWDPNRGHMVIKHHISGKANSVLWQGDKITLI